LNSRRISRESARYLGKGLDEAGYSEGRNVAIDIVGQIIKAAILLALAAELVERGVDMIVARADGGGRGQSCCDDQAGFFNSNRYIFARIKAA
jgi:hypothetical protein